MKNYSFKNLDFDNKNKKKSKKNLTNIIQKRIIWNKKGTQIMPNEDINIVNVIKNILGDMKMSKKMENQIYSI